MAEDGGREMHKKSHKIQLSSILFLSWCQQRTNSLLRPSSNSQSHYFQSRLNKRAAYERTLHNVHTFRREHSRDKQKCSTDFLFNTCIFFSVVLLTVLPANFIYSFPLCVVPSNSRLWIFCLLRCLRSCTMSIIT